MRSEEDAEDRRDAMQRTDTFEDLIRLHRPALTRFAARQLGEHAELAEDVVQEALLNAHRAIASGTRPEHPRAWLFTIVRNAAINTARATRSTGEIEEDFATAEETVPAAVEQGEWIDWLMGAVGRLPARQREALVGHAFEGRSYREIATRQQTTVSAVKSLIGRARRALSAESSYPVAGLGMPFARAARGLSALLGRGPWAGKFGAKGLAGAIAQAALAATVTTGVLMSVHAGNLGSVLASPGPAKLSPGGGHLSGARTARHRHRTETKHAREQRIHREGHHAINDCLHGRALHGRYREAALKYAVKHLSPVVTEYTECEQLLRHAELHPGSHRRTRARHRHPRSSVTSRS